MFYFSINKRALATIKREAKATDREIIGVLVGRVYDNLLVVNKAVSGEQASGITRVKLDNATLAKIVNEIMTGDLEGNILGWYHSHPGFGVFMSHTDIGTQELLQQFSPKVAALVIDPKEDKFGVFTLNSNHGVIQIPDEQIFKFKDGEDGIPQDLKDAHLFEAKLEITPEAVADRIRYVIECTKAHWPEKKCLVCGAELKFDEASRKWYCPTNEDRIKKQLEEAAKSRKPDKAHYKCKECEIPLKYSKKINAWYCKKCRRVFKHRLKAKNGEEKAQIDKVLEDEVKDKKIAESELIETAEALEDEEKDATVKAVEVKNEGTGVAVNEKSDAAIESRDQEVPSKDMPESEVAAVNSNPSVKSEVKVSVKSKVTKRAVGTKPKKHVKKSRRKIKRTNK